ncbi:hypothetical protein JW916_00390 [Candidatus Sumerlaeota bacterium]|nr:hypothetical protein [Candidatus Sumerlaeota bacterium]
MTRESLCLAVLFLALSATFVYFEEEAAGWNVNTRIALTYSIVEQGSFSIDRYHEIPYLETGDKAYYGGHFYCDKTPGLSFLAVPFYWLLWTLKAQWGLLPGLPHWKWVLWTRYLVRIPTVSLTAAALGVLLAAMARRVGLSRRMAFALSVGLLLGTFLFGYAIMFYPYLPGAFFSVSSYALVFFKRELWRRPGASPPTDIARGSRLFWAGLLLGMGWLCEYTVGLLGIGLGLYTLWAVRHRPASIWKYVVGGALSVVAFYSYTHAIFGEFSIPYKYEHNPFFREEMAKGFQGIHLPRLSVLLLITFHPFKGLFFYCPFLLLWILGVYRGFSDPSLRRARPDVLLSLFVVVAYLLFNSGYYMWWGGWSAGTRLLCPAIPFFLIPIALHLRQPGKGLRTIFGILIAISIFWNLVITSVTPQIPPGFSDERLVAADVSEAPHGPIHEAIWPAFFGGLDGTVVNAGQILMGLPGLLSLIPLFTFWIVVSIGVCGGCRETPTSDVNASL